MNNLAKMKSGKIKYFFTVSITIIAMVIIISYTFSSFYTIAYRDVKALGEEAVNEQSEIVNNFLMQGTNVLQATALTVDYMMETGASPDEIKDFLTAQSEDFSTHIDESFTGIYGVFDDVYIDGVGWVPDEGYAPELRPWYIAAKENKGKTAVVSPYVDAQTGKVMISVSQMLSDGKSAVSLDIYMDKLQEMTQSFQINGNGYGFITDDNGFIVAHSDTSLNGKNYLVDTDLNSPEMASLIQKTVDGKEGAAELKIDGSDSIAFSKTVYDSWHIVLIVSHYELFREVQNVLLISIVLAIIILLVVVLFCSDAYRNRVKATNNAAELEKYRLTLEERVREKTLAVTQQTEKIVRLQANVVEGMATLIESRDGNTGEHVHNTKMYVSMMLSHMLSRGLYPDVIDENYVRSVTNATVLHDVGKIHISDVILNKPGKFTPEEYEVMKNHTIIGSKIVKEIFSEVAGTDFAQIASDIAHYHHEKWDGSGYPDGLSGEEIPLCARIMAVADVFDALVSKRVYKDKIPADKAFEVLQNDAGKHFDPEIVAVFLEIRPEVEMYINSICDN